MFYTPKHCSECGEKINDGGSERKFSASRFCETCAGEFKIHDWLPRVVLGLGIVLTLFGIGSFLRKSDKPLTVTTTPVTAPPPANKSQNVQNPPLLANGDVQISAPKQMTAANVVAQPGSRMPESSLNVQLTKRGLLEKPQNPASETVYFCGAQTKKGTPCTRRVKGGGRCWQHSEQPAMLPPEKLVASR